MLLINDDEVGQKELEEIFGTNVIPFKKILKRPEFEINPKRKQHKKMGQSQEISSPVGTRVHAHFKAKWQGRTLTIRYSEYSQEEPVVPGSDRIITKHYPNKVMFTGESMLNPNNDLGVDLSIFFFLHFLNEFSPFRDQFIEPFHWSFNDTQAKAAKDMDAIKVLQKAINVVLKLEGMALKVLAKGLGFHGVEDMEPETIQAQLVKRAQRDPQTFIDEANSQRTAIKGLVVNAIDNDLFKLNEANGRKRFIWGKGDQQGIQIVEVLDNGKSPVETMQEHVSNNINTFYPILMNSHTMIAAEQKADDFLEKKGAFDFSTAFKSGLKSVEQDEFGGGTTNIMDRENHLNAGNNLNQDADFLREAAAGAGITMETKQPDFEDEFKDIDGDTPEPEDEEIEEEFAFLKEKPAPVKKPGAKK